MRIAAVEGDDDGGVIAESLAVAQELDAFDGDLGGLGLILDKRNDLAGEVIERYRGAAGSAPLRTYEYAGTEYAGLPANAHAETGESLHSPVVFDCIAMLFGPGSQIRVLSLPAWIGDTDQADIRAAGGCAVAVPEACDNCFAIAVDELIRRAFASVCMLVAPLADCSENHDQVATGLGQLVAAAGAVARLAILHGFQHAGRHEFSQPGAEDIRGNPQLLLELRESSSAQECFANDQHRPPLPKDRHSARNGAGIVGPRISTHYLMVSELVSPIQDGTVRA